LIYIKKNISSNVVLTKFINVCRQLNFVLKAWKDCCRDLFLSHDIQAETIIIRSQNYVMLSNFGLLCVIYLLWVLIQIWVESSVWWSWCSTDFRLIIVYFCGLFYCCNSQHIPVNSCKNHTKKGALIFVHDIQAETIIIRSQNYVMLSNFGLLCVIYLLWFFFLSFYDRNIRHYKAMFISYFFFKMTLIHFCTTCICKKTTFEDIFFFI
jgi:hypothetical protein